MPDHQPLHRAEVPCQPARDGPQVRPTERPGEQNIQGKQSGRVRLNGLLDVCSARIAPSSENSENRLDLLPGRLPNNSRPYVNPDAERVGQVHPPVVPDGGSRQQVQRPAGRGVEAVHGHLHPSLDAFKVETGDDPVVGDRKVKCGSRCRAKMARPPTVGASVRLGVRCGIRAAPGPVRRSLPMYWRPPLNGDDARARPKLDAP